jgi:hypothetical protein
MAQDNSTITMYQQDGNGRATLVEHTLTDAQQAIRDRLRATLADVLVTQVAGAIVELAATGLPAHAVFELAGDVLRDLMENGFMVVAED